MICHSDISKEEIIFIKYKNRFSLIANAYPRNSVFFCIIMKSIYLILIVILFGSCAEYTPKPTAYPRIEREIVEMLTYENNEFSFQYPNTALIEQLPANNKEGIWFNILYPQDNATLYCTYIPLKKETLPKILEESHQLTYSHALKASEIKQSQFENKSHRVSGMLYDIKGAVATPVQFFITDSVSHFLRGSLYYNLQVNPDSVAPMTEFMRNDIINIMETIEWKD